MKKLLGITALTVMMALPGIASADDSKPMGVYVGGHLGMSIERFSDREQHELNEGITFGFSSDTDTVFAGGLSVGYDFDPQFDIPIRVELDYTARSRAEAKSSQTVAGSPGDPAALYDLSMKDKITLQTLMFNAWWDIPLDIPVTPYIGGGIGFGFINYKGYNDSVSDNGSDDEFLSGSANETNFAWSLGGGMTYDVTENWIVDLGYRYIDAGDISKTFKDDAGDDSSKSKLDVTSHDIMLGIRYTF